MRHKTFRPVPRTRQGVCTNGLARHTPTSLNTTSPCILHSFGFDSQRPSPRSRSQPRAGRARAAHPPSPGAWLGRRPCPVRERRRPPGVLIDAPPGGGKTAALTTLLSHLANRFGTALPVVTVATPTRARATFLYERLVKFVHPTQIDLNIHERAGPLEGALTSKEVEAIGGSKIEIRTLASLRMARGGRSKQGGRRILLVDEGYQATFADVAAAASTSD